MILREICSEALSIWEECLIAASYLNNLELHEAALEETRRSRVCGCLLVLQALPEEYARELCFEVLRQAELQGNQS